MSLDHLFTNLRTRKMLSSAVILFTLALGVVIGTVITGAVGAARDQIAPGATPLSIPAPAALSSEFVKVAKMVEPSVVNINVESVVKTQPMVRRRTPHQARNLHCQPVYSLDGQSRRLDQETLVDDPYACRERAHENAILDRDGEK